MIHSFLKYRLTSLSILSILLFPFLLQGQSEKFYGKAVNAFNEGKPSLSIQYADSALQFDEWNSDALYVRGNAYEMVGEEKKAIIDYEKIVYKDKSYLEAYLAMAILYYQQKNYQKALASLRAIDGYNGIHETRAVLFKSAVFGPSSGKSQGVNGVTTIESMRNDILYLKALIYKETGSLDKARKNLEDLLLKKNHADYHVALGLVFEKTKELELAKKSYTNALEIDPTHLSAAYQLQLIDPAYKVPESLYDNEDFHYALAKKAYDFYNVGDYQSALVYYNKAIKAGPEVSDYYSYRGLVNEKLRRYDAALLDYTTSVAKDAHMVVNYYRIGNVKSKQKEYKEAAASYTLYLSYVPDDPDILYNLGITYLNLKKREEACNSLQLAKKHGKAGVSELLLKYCQNP